MKLSAILLAGGTSARMGEINKMLLPFAGQALFLNAYHNLIASKVDELLVVTGFEAKKIEALLCQREAKHKVVYNANFQTGMTGSIQVGIQQCADNSDGFMICLADMPFLKTKDYNKLIDAFKSIKNSAKSIVAPSFENHLGNPKIFAAYYKDIILNHKAPNGCKAILQKHQEQLVKITFNNPSIFTDIDNLEVYNKTKAKLNR